MLLAIERIIALPLTAVCPLPALTCTARARVFDHHRAVISLEPRDFAMDVLAQLHETPSNPANAHCTHVVWRRYCAKMPVDRPRFWCRITTPENAESVAFGIERGAHRGQPVATLAVTPPNRIVFIEIDEPSESNASSQSPRY
jgi:hypothetical protein